MSKKALCFVLTIFIIASMVLLPTVSALAEEMPADSAEEISVTEVGNEDSTIVPEDVTEPFTEPEPTCSQYHYPMLTVNAISNYFGKAYAEYNEYTDEVTVTYLLKASKRLLTTQWELVYDSTELTVDPEKNTLETICPKMKSSAAFSIEKDLITFAATDLRMYDFSTEEAPFVQIVFDVVDNPTTDPLITKVDLTVRELWASEPNPTTGYAQDGKEFILVSNGEVNENKRNDAVLVSKITSLTPSNYVEPIDVPTTADDATADSLTQTEPTTVQPTTTAPTVAPIDTSQPAESKNNASKNWEPLIKTGSGFVALIILLIVSAATVVLFVMRKRELYKS